jgi:hypothetical protein
LIAGNILALAGYGANAPAGDPAKRPALSNKKAALLRRLTSHL